MTTAKLAARRSYIQKGDAHFASQSHDLARHMRAAARVSQAPPLPDPGVTGQLDAQTIATMWTITTYIGDEWQLSGSSMLDPYTFTLFINLKTNEVPSYFTIYGQTAALYQTLVDQYGEPAALAYLYQPNQANPPPNWDAVRAWAIQEFTNLYICKGAFRAYGWLLYPGFGGGYFDNPNNLPYRPMTNAD